MPRTLDVTHAFLIFEGQIPSEINLVAKNAQGSVCGENKISSIRGVEVLIPLAGNPTKSIDLFLKLAKPNRSVKLLKFKFLSYGIVRHIES
jgi:hypothetical protein